MSCILRHRGVQLIFAYSWARPAILAAGKSRGGCLYFFCFFTFIHYPLSPLSLSFISSTISSFSLLPFSGRRHKLTLKGWRVVKPQHKSSFSSVPLFNLLYYFFYLSSPFLWETTQNDQQGLAYPQHNQSNIHDVESTVKHTWRCTDIDTTLQPTLLQRCVPTGYLLWLYAE